MFFYEFNVFHYQKSFPGTAQVYSRIKMVKYWVINYWLCLLRFQIMCAWCCINETIETADAFKTMNILCNVPHTNKDFQKQYSKSFVFSFYLFYFFSLSLCKYWNYEWNFFCYRELCLKTLFSYVSVASNFAQFTFIQTLASKFWLKIDGGYNRFS